MNIAEFKERLSALVLDVGVLNGAIGHVAGEIVMRESGSRLGDVLTLISEQAERLYHEAIDIENLLGKAVAV